MSLLQQMNALGGYVAPGQLSFLGQAPGYGIMPRDPGHYLRCVCCDREWYQRVWIGAPNIDLAAALHDLEARAQQMETSWLAERGGLPVATIDNPWDTD